MPTALILLSLVPMGAGTARLTELASGAAVTAENARFIAVPLPVIIHIVSASLYSILGALQFVRKFRRGRPSWHKISGRLLVPFGLAAALSGLWMTVFYPKPPGDGPSLTAVRLVVGSAMVVAILLGFAAIRRRDITEHRAWMIRGYAIGVGAGTQVFTHLPYLLLVGIPGELARTLLMAAGWAINLAVAEWVIRRQPRRVPALAV